MWGTILSHLSKIPVSRDEKEFLDKTPKLFNSVQKQDHSEKNWFMFFSTPKSNNSSSITTNLLRHSAHSR